MTLNFEKAGKVDVTLDVGSVGATQPSGMSMPPGNGGQMHKMRAPSKFGAGAMKSSILAAILIGLAISPLQAETPDEWIALGSRVHGGFGSFIPLGIKIGLDAVGRLKAQTRELTVLYYDSEKSPCACFADGIAIATYASVGQRTLTIASEKAPGDTLAVIIIRPRKGGPGYKYTIPVSDLAKIGPMNAKLDSRGRWDAVMKEDGLFTVEAVP